MREIILYTVFLLLLIMQGCKNDDIIFDKNNLLLGNWEFQNSSEEFENTVYHMKRTKLLTEKYGTMKFSADGGFSWYQSTGFAGQLTLITGNWIAVNDSVIQLYPLY
jgi:hypothetical protein